MAVAAAQKNREMFAIKKSYSVEKAQYHFNLNYGGPDSQPSRISFHWILRKIKNKRPGTNGYPSRRRSLVEDARFESLVVKQTKQTVLEEARQRSNDETTVVQAEELTPELVVVVTEGEVETTKKLHDPEYSGADSEGSAEEDSAFEEVSAEEDSSNDADLTEEEVIIMNAASESKEAENTIQQASLVLSMRDGISSLARILKTIENYKGKVTHLESRPSNQQGMQFDLLVKVEMTRASLLVLIRSLRQSASLGGVTLLNENNVSVKAPWFPKHASDLDSCNHLMTKYEPELDMNHPGFADKVYRERRKDIASIAFSYKYGDKIPRIEYTESEVSTWNSVFNTVLDLNPKHACIEYQRVFKKLQDEDIFTPHRIPQLEEMSAFMKKHTGFTLRPAAGLLTARDFLASLAFRVFQSTQYVRHTSSPYHTPEPDCIHEMLGHMPLLADPNFAQFSQEIGLASLGASDAEIEKLSTVYWFTVEFGLCKEGDQVKAYGAGLLSSYGELLHALSDKPELRPFEPESTAVQTYQDQEYQPIYYVAESFEDAKEKFRSWVSKMSRPFEVRFNPHTERVEILDSVDKLEGLISQLNTEFTHLNNAITKLQARYA